MLNFLFNKKKPDLKNEATLDVDLGWFEKLTICPVSMEHPNWPMVYDYIDENLSSLDRNQLFTQLARRWARSMVNAFEHEYAISETENFILVSSDAGRYSHNLIQYLERCRKRLLNLGKGVLQDEGFGKHVVIVFADIDAYYDYVSSYDGREEEFGLSSGMFLNFGYGHFVFQHGSLDDAEPIAAHEMTHALLSHLPIPLWLNEGLAVNMESVITGIPVTRLSQSIFDQHHNFWNHKTIQEFWSGESFSRPDEGQQLSYQMAQILVSNLSSYSNEFIAFINAADWQDAGKSAFEKAFGSTLNDVVSQFLGEGNWEPKNKIYSN